MSALYIHPALLRYLPLMLLRGSTIVLKFGLSFYVARFIGLSEWVSTVSLWVPPWYCPIFTEPA